MYNNCSNRGCTGVNEFMGVKESENNNITVKHRIEETDFKETSEPLILVYRCSKCRSLSFQLNLGYETFISDYNKAYYKSLDCR